MKKNKQEVVYILAHHKNGNDYWVLPRRNGLNVATLVTYLLEEVIVDTDWQIEVVNSLDYVEGSVRWIYSDAQDFCKFIADADVWCKDSNQIS